MIGIFDSGVGGLTVVKEVFKKLPDYQIIYFGDTARTPYGTKSKETIIKYAREDAKFLLEGGAKIIVIACNTASAMASDVLQKELGVPVFEVIMPAVRRALDVTKNRKVGVIGTRATIGSGVYEKLLKIRSAELAPQYPRQDVLLQVFSQACPLLVPLVEECWLDKPETKKIVKKCLQPLKNKQIDTLILGCTHYPVLKHIIGPRIGRRVRLVDSAEEVVRELQKFLTANPLVKKTLTKGAGHKFYVSDLTPQLSRIAEKLLEQRVDLEKVEVG